MWRMCFLLMIGSAAEHLCAQADIRWVTVTPTAVNFTSADPDTGSAIASSTINWRIRDGSTSRDWLLRVYSAAPNVSGCPKVPLSSFQVSCLSVVVPKGGNGICTAPVSLSSAPQVVASGDQGDRKTNSTAELRVQFLDSWKYPGALSPSCSIAITYAVEAL